MLEKEAKGAYNAVKRAHIKRIAHFYAGKRKKKQTILCKRLSRKMNFFKKNRIGFSKRKSRLERRKKHHLHL